MRAMVQRVCWCWFGRPVTHDLVNKDVEKIFDTSEGMAEDMIDTSEWAYSESKDIKPDVIPDKHLTREYTVGRDNYSVTEQVRRLGYELNGIIGGGGFGQVYRAYTVDSQGRVDRNGEEVAVKRMKLSGRYGVRSKNKMTSLKNELFTLVKSNHPNIISIIDHFIVNDECFLVMEFAEQGSMSDDVRHNGSYSESKAKTYFGQMSSAIYYLHCCLGFAHLDIKLGNVLIVIKGDHKVIKVSDFGLSRLRIDGDKGVIQETDPKGTLTYMSPQVLRLYVSDRLNEESIYGKVRPFNPFIADVWSLGVCLYVMLCRNHPFDMEDDPRLFREVLIAQKEKKWLSRSEWRKVVKKVSIECQDIIEDMIEPNPHKRLTIQNIVSHIWFEGMYEIRDLTHPKPRM